MEDADNAMTDEKNNGPIPWTMLEKFGLWGVLAYLVVTNSITTNNQNTTFFQTKFITAIESCATALSATAAELKRKDDVIEDNTKAMEKVTEQMASLAERVNRLLTRSWNDASAANDKPQTIPVSTTP